MNILLNELFPAVLPVLLQTLSTLLTALLIWVANVARVRWGIEIEARHREALHTAIMSGIRAALSRGLTGQALVTATLSHVANSTPEALSKLKPKDGVLEEIIEGKLREVIDGVPLFEVEIGGDQPVRVDRTLKHLGKAVAQSAPVLLLGMLLFHGAPASAETLDAVAVGQIGAAAILGAAVLMVLAGAYLVAWLACAWRDTRDDF